MSGSTAVVQSITGWPGMPTPKSKSAPKEFSGDPEDLHDFLNDYETSADGAQLTDEQKCKFLLKYVDRSTRYLIEVLDAFKAKNWKDLADELRNLFGTKSSTRRYRTSELKSLVKVYAQKIMRSETELKTYIRDFSRVAMWLKEKNKITEEDVNRRFWFGFHPTTREQLAIRIHAKNPTATRDTPYSFNTIKEAAEFLFSDDAFDAETSSSSDSDSESDSESESEFR